jgi:hypothetical protein
MAVVYWVECPPEYADGFHAPQYSMLWDIRVFGYADAVIRISGYPDTQYRIADIRISEMGSRGTW